MKRRTLIVGNWKMNGLIETAKDLAEDLVKGMVKREKKKILCEVAICPPFTALSDVHQVLVSSAIKLGAQNMSPEVGGAHTGEICGVMLRNVGCRFVILGHSERRQFYNETDADVTLKVSAAFRDGLTPIICLGESEAERRDDQTFDVLSRQLDAVMPALADMGKDHKTSSYFTLAYEPVWAIGTGQTATPEEAQNVHKFLRQKLVAGLGETIAGKTRIIYGGSMKPGNAATLLNKPDVDGGLIGGAALKAKDFLSILDAVPN